MTSRSLSLAAYRAFSRHGFRAAQPFAADRPAGKLIWVHCPNPEMRDGACCLVARLIEHDPDLALLLTSAVDGPAPAANPAQAGVIIDRIPQDHPAAVATFLDHWRPDVVLWLGGWLQPNLVEDISRRRTPLLLLWADTAGFDGRRDRWLPELSSHMLRRFTWASATSTRAQQKLLRLGMPAPRLELTSPLKRVGQVLPCDPTEHDEMAQVISGRPVWLAASAHAHEIGMILNAHRAVLRREHRLLLILAPGSPEALTNARAGSAEFNCADWSEGALPSDRHSILLAENTDDLGLWYRLASVSLQGGTLTPGQTGRDPLEAAALGSAVLYGPNLGAHLHTYSRLSQAGAARIVNSDSSLAAALSSLIAPDKAASMAHAGWDIATEGSTTIDRVVAKVQDILDGPSKAHGS